MNETELTTLLQGDGEIVTERLDHWAATTGDQPFFHYGEDDVTLTYGEFADRTDSLAGNLAALGVDKGDRVSVFCTNQLLSALMMFGIWKAGAVYCPVNYSYTGRLLTYQLNDTKPVLIVTDATLLPAMNTVADDLQDPPMVVVYEPGPGAHDHGSTCDTVHPILTEHPWTALTADSSRPAVTVSFDDPANIIYTSGTTGPSKGVLQPYRWMAQYVFNLRLPLTSDDVIYNDLPMYHVGGAMANVGRAAFVGCEVAVWDRFSPGDFWERVASRGATATILVDVMIPWLMKAPESDDDRKNTLNKMHMQPLPARHNQFATRFGIDFVSAGFGQTEAGAPLALVIEETTQGEGTPSELYRGLSHTEIRERAEAIGTPVLAGDQASHDGLMGIGIPFVDVDVLDGDDQPCSDGVPGELAVRARLPSVLMTEYIGKPEATEKAWRSGWFHTGDAAIRQTDGMFSFVDRLGDRIRVRGENLSSFQVEDVLNQHPGVALCAAFAIRSVEGDEDDVVVFVVKEDDSELAEQDIHDYAAKNMPKFMRPRYIRVVSEIPRTPTNKIEKYKLRAQMLKEVGDR